jgi:phosphatidylglycerophosphatase A
MKRLAVVISSGFGSGFIKPGPGTWGTAVAFLISAMIYVSGVSDSLYIPIILTIAFYAAGLWSIGVLEDEWEDDDQRIVVDEMIGYWITIILIPISWTSLILAFFLFRAFDIVKPFGIRRFDEIKTNWAVLVDDVVAGIYANIALRIILLLIAWQS